MTELGAIELFWVVLIIGITLAKYVLPPAGIALVVGVIVYRVRKKKDQK